MADRTTKLLPVVIALALWGLRLRPGITPLPAQAQDGGVNTATGMVVTDRDVYIRSGTSLFRFERNLVLKDCASIEVVNGDSRYVHHSP
jgi:hypothetical protein